jgi:hypothetical protein
MTMAETLAPLHALDQQIAEAYAELLTARSEWAHSPNADSIRTEQYAEMRLNRLLERRHAAKN